MDELRRIRLEKLDQLRSAGIAPYPDRFELTHTATTAAPLPDGSVVRIAGRLVARRAFGKLIFAVLQDASGRLQISFEQNVLPEAAFAIASELLDIGDIIGIDGEMWTTKKGERTVRTRTLTVLSKSLRPLPEKFHGLQDREARSRQRYLDLIANRETFERFALRSRIISHIRRFLDSHNFLEVETPILQVAASGAAARPFTTHHNSLDRTLYLRISPETYLKRVIVGGFDRVYEIGKNFRNEGIDASHLQEFTMLEWYASFWNFRDNMAFVQRLIREILTVAVGTLEIPYAGVTLDFGKEWPEVRFVDAVKQETGIDLLQVATYEELARAVVARYPAFDIGATATYPALIDALYKKVVRPNLIQPTFLTYHPTELVPLARRNDENGSVLDMFQVVVNSWEIVKAYSELIDPIDQLARMEEQQRYRESGDDETMMLEMDYIECMEYGMPPNSGLGLGIDRLIALITGAESLRDVILFPSMRDTQGAAEDESKPEVAIEN